MDATRRYWTTAALGGSLAVLAVAADRPLLLVGAAGVGGWLLVRQHAFLRSLLAAADDLSVDQTLARDRATPDEPVTATLAASLATGSPLAMSIEASPPVAARAPDPAVRTLALAPDQTAASTQYALEWPVAGAYVLPPPTVTATDPAGVVAESFASGPSPSILIRPRAPRDIHVGAGGGRVAAAFGEHPTGRRGRGFDPVEIREYAPGDSVSRIDWKATARLNRPHVREFATETDRMTVLVVDHRAPMGVGPAGETKLDYARQVALAFLDQARSADDPLGLYSVGDAGVTGQWTPTATPETYAALQDRITALQPTARDPSRPSGGRGRSPAAARRDAARLDGNETAFARTLRPFLAAMDPYVERIERDPLARTVRTYLGPLRGTVWTVLLTDDTDRAQVREAVKLARRGDDHVLAFLTPTVLFEPGGLGDLERAYERYRGFEDFRRDLAAMDRVSAFEVAPGDRLEAVLATGRREPARGRA